MKWFCAVSAATLDFGDHRFRDLIRVAVGSAQRHTRLRPHIIYDGPVNDFTEQMVRMGAVVIHHRTPLYDDLAKANPGDPNWLHVAAGAYLRFEVPIVERSEDFALYTDCDVLFLKDPDFGNRLPLIFGATSQFSENPAEDMNSGVMLINLANMRQVLPMLYDFTRERLLYSADLDQEMLTAFFGKNYEVLDRTLNWKPYWGWNPAAQIVHFHGPKPLAARDYLVDGIRPHNEAWAGLLTWNREGYEAYTRLWHLYRDTLLPRPASV